MFKMFNPLEVLKNGNQSLNFRLDFLAVYVSLIETSRTDLNES
jgi:hypothetical protein